LQGPLQFVMYPPVVRGPHYKMSTVTNDFLISSLFRAC